jgi:hypothetical protein
LQKPGWILQNSAGPSISNGCQEHTTSPYAAPFSVKTFAALVARRSPGEVMVRRTGLRQRQLRSARARSKNIENNPMQSSRRPALMLRKQVDTSGKSGAFLHHPAIQFSLSEVLILSTM